MKKNNYYIKKEIKKMKKKNPTLFLVLLILLILIVGGFLVYYFYFYNKQQKPIVVPKETEINESLYNGYYKNSNISVIEGNELIIKLNDLLSKNTKKVNYGQVRNILLESDVKYEKETVLHGIYDNRELVKKWDGGNTYTREHVWPNSRLGIPRVNNNDVNQGSDPHNLRAIWQPTNASRSNNYFVEGSGNIGYIVTKNKSYYPGDSHKGDVARILMYMAVRYKDILKLVKVPTGDSYSPNGAFMGDLTILYKWHLEDPVDKFEVNRNEVIFKHQNNRNPFIDYPGLFKKVWEHFMKVNKYEIKKEPNSLLIFIYNVDITIFNKQQIY